MEDGCKGVMNGGRSEELIRAVRTIHYSDVPSTAVLEFSFGHGGGGGVGASVSGVGAGGRGVGGHGVGRGGVGQATADFDHKLKGEGVMSAHPTTMFHNSQLWMVGGNPFIIDLYN